MENVESKETIFRHEELHHAYDIWWCDECEIGFDEFKNKESFENLKFCPNCGAKIKAFIGSTQKAKEYVAEVSVSSVKDTVRLTEIDEFYYRVEAETIKDAKEVAFNELKSQFYNNDIFGKTDILTEFSVEIKILTAEDEYVEGDEFFVRYDGYNVEVLEG